MARFARAVAVGVPHHVTHRGNRRGDVFFSLQDRTDYLALLADYAQRNALDIWGYCLMTNHIHLLAVPRRPDSLARAIGLAHMRHSRAVNARRGWTGHLWAGRYFSTALDAPHLWTAIKYIELNPVRARLTRRAEDWGHSAAAWSSARAHAGGAADPLLAPDRPFVSGAVRHPLNGRTLPWSDWLKLAMEDRELEALRRHTMTGRPLGDERFIKRIQTALDRDFALKKRGRKPKGAL